MDHPAHNLIYVACGRQLWAFTYDAFNRLATSANASYGNSYSYGYDRFGNRWHQTRTAGTGFNVDYTFDANNRNTTGGFVYDAAGNLTSDGTCTPCWSYDVMSHLTGKPGKPGDRRDVTRFSHHCY